MKNNSGAKNSNPTTPTKPQANPRPHPPALPPPTAHRSPGPERTSLGPKRTSKGPFWTQKDLLGTRFGTSFGPPFLHPLKTPKIHNPLPGIPLPQNFPPAPTPKNIFSPNRIPHPSPLTPHPSSLIPHPPDSPPQSKTATSAVQSTPTPPQSAPARFPLWNRFCITPSRTSLDPTKGTLLHVHRHR